MRQIWIYLESIQEIGDFEKHEMAFLYYAISYNRPHPGGTTKNEILEKLKEWL